MEDLNDKVTGGELSADNWNQPASEIQNAIEATGQTLSGANLFQLLTTLSTLNDRCGFCTATGASTSTDWVVVPGFGMLVPAGLTDGLRVQFLAPFGGTTDAGSTLKLGGLTAKNIVTRLGSTPVARTTTFFTAGEVVDCQYVVALDAWVLLSPYPTGLSTERGTFKRATPAQLAAPFSGGGTLSVLTALDAYRSPGWKSINAILNGDFNFSEGVGIVEIPALTIPLDSYDIAAGGDQRYAYKALVRMSNLLGTKDGSFYLFIDTDAGSSITVSGTARYYNDASNTLFVDNGPFRNSDFSTPNVQCEVPDGALHVGTSSGYAILEGIATITNNGRSLYLRVQHTGSGSATVTIQDKTYITLEKL